MMGAHGVEGDEAVGAVVDGDGGPPGQVRGLLLTPRTAAAGEEAVLGSLSVLEAVSDDLREAVVVLDQSPGLLGAECRRGGQQLLRAVGPAVLLGPVTGDRSRPPWPLGRLGLGRGQVLAPVFRMRQVLQLQFGDLCQAGAVDETGRAEFRCLEIDDALIERPGAGRAVGGPQGEMLSPVRQRSLRGREFGDLHNSRGV
ncbi:hypothetical protein [Streptomyces sp. R02]|uniref:Uncharacterized protein n=1 Tax=Streptomyces sp. R02 TaxID=3238623 RepID=A0AB39LVC0_9ACTN